MTRSNAFTLERGASNIEALESNVQRALEGVRAHTGELATSAQANAYTAGTSGNWTAPAPTTHAEAIDRLAAAVAGLLGTPIP